MRKTIMLVCSAGMSTSLLVRRMQEAAEKRALDLDIFSISASDLDNQLEEKTIDFVLLGPQVTFLKNQIASRTELYNIPVEVVDMYYFGLMNGEKVLEKVLLKLMDN